MERVKRQIAERESPGQIAKTSSNDPVLLRLPSRSAPFER
jgi:hypothetical protein